jgi:hypothetical protein
VGDKVSQAQPRFGPASAVGRTEGGDNSIVRSLSVRVDGDRGFIIFDGVGDRVNNMPLAREGGEWRVAGVGPIPLQY